MASLQRWDPFRDVRDLQTRMDRLFGPHAVTIEREGALTRFSPAVDIYEDAEGVTLSLEVAGVDPKGLEVKVEDSVLTVSGERKLEKEESRTGYHRIERSYGSFTRSFTLPPTLDVEKVKAENKHGVLKVFLPRKDDQKPRKITVAVDA